MNSDKLAQALRDLLAKVRRDAPELSGKLMGHCDAVLAEHEAEKQAGSWAIQATAPVDETPFGYYYKSLGGSGILHVVGEASDAVIAADMAAAREYPAGHKCIPLFTHVQALAAHEAEKQAGPVAETCSICGEGKALLVRHCDHCGSDYAGPSEMRANSQAAPPSPLTEQHEFALVDTVQRQLDIRIPDWRALQLARAVIATDQRYRALTDEGRTRALNLAYQFRSHPASRSIDEIEQAGELILSLLALASPLTEQDKDDAERYRCLKEMVSGSPMEGSYFFPGIDAWGGDVPMDPLSIDQAVDAIRAARAKKDKL